MAELLEFPTREKQAFLFLQQELARLLKAKGADDALIDYAITSLTDVYGELQRESDCHFEVRLPSRLSQEEALRLQQDVAAGVEQLRQEHCSKGMPDDLAQILALAGQADVRILILDADAPVLPGLPLAGE